MAEAEIFLKLKQDHDLHRRLLGEIDAAADGQTRGDLLANFKVEVTAHAAAEEESLYATMLADPELRHEAQHSVAEHKEIEDYLKKLSDMAPDSDEWRECYAHMKHRYTHHIDEEEEEMFPEAAKELDAETQAELGEKFDERKPAELERAR
ncbi:hemerythrin domain-containing protein [Sphingomonas sp. ID0503]|uniref:hemerythrin domain-containing protein n=1 Tax=Sphingomonas sp. ID0503 TaxID=3399691 RepID=UPI003AFB21CC